MARQRKRSKRLYLDLFDDRKLLSEGKPEHRPEITLFPNGQPEMWIRGPKGLGFMLRVSGGPHGISVNVRTFVGSPGVVATGNREGDYAPQSAPAPFLDLSIVQYHGDDDSQALKRWYLATPEERERDGIHRPA